MSDMRWCSDGFEIKCDSGETVTATFAKDCCDREILAWRAWEGKGLPGEPVRNMLVDAPTVLAQLPAAFEHFNEIHPHSSLKTMSPRESRGGRIIPPIRPNAATGRRPELRGARSPTWLSAPRRDGS